MFTVKFYADQDEEHISCPRYSVHKTDDGGIMIVCFKDLVGVSGVEFHVSPDSWHACFVENSTGKTVDKHRARLED